MKITNIKQAVKNPNRANIFVDGKYTFSLDIAQLSDFKLKIGQEITDAELADYQHASFFGKLYQRTLEWVLMRPRSIRETEEYLRRKHLDYLKKSADNSANFSDAIKNFSEDASQIIDTLIAKKYLDDYVFATYYIENRFTKKGISQKRLRLELTKKGVAKNVIDEVLSSDLRNDADEIKKLIAKKRAKYDDEKLIQYLVRQGFDFETARNSVRETD